MPMRVSLILYSAVFALLSITASAATPITADYTISASDCGSTLIASGGQFSVTWPVSLAGFADGCEVRLVNADSDRGKKLANWPAVSRAVLYPEAITAAMVYGGALVPTSLQGRWRIRSSQNICVDTSGDDSNDGLGTAASPATGCKRHIAAAIAMAYNDMDAQGATIKIVPTSGQTFDEGAGNAMTGQITGANAMSIAPSGSTAFTWQSTGWCLNVGDNAEAIIYGPITWKCNTANSAYIGAVYEHQIAVIDLYGAHTWIPGGSVRKVLTSPSATYSYFVGTGGTAGTAGTGGFAGGAGAAGIIIVRAYFS